MYLLLIKINVQMCGCSDIHQGSKNVFESVRQFGHLEERLVAKLSLVSKSEIP